MHIINSFQYFDLNYFLYKRQLCHLGWDYWRRHLVTTLFHIFIDECQLIDHRSYITVTPLPD